MSVERFASKRQRMGLMTASYGIELIRAVLTAGWESFMIETPDAVADLCCSTPGHVAVHDMLIALAVACQYYMFEYNDAIGPDFTTVTWQQLANHYATRRRADCAVAMTRND